ncbi:hypothetical protein JJJ17_09290 [Paracoccus caeni]|uniref:Uncharacterized protein n=1 Tax=Paracoccus caeni TaxID=657651 RepID=A0A934SKL1_9RHOB|nr:hypothetical protein [Paracoccus caeni]MBK4216118.1 hypothetical protein [Paracoccus caeni]
MAELIWRTFRAPSQAEVARRTADYLRDEVPDRTVTERTVINWLQCRHDMPHWAARRIQSYAEAVERLARRIEG